MKKIFKYGSLIIFFGLIIGFITAFSRSWDSPPSIIASGSTAVQPLLTHLGDGYKGADVTVQPGGSSMGMKVAAEASKSLGNVSKNPYMSVEEASKEKDGYDKTDWENNKLKTVTIAWDGIAIVYKPTNINDKTLVINQDNISMIYETFSGAKKHKLSDLYIGHGNDTKPTSSDNFIVPYARTGGSKASGTATSFATESNFTPPTSEKEKENWDKWQDALKSGNYGPGVQTTNESNVESWNRFMIENVDNGMIYLSLGFAEVNRKIIEDNGYKIAQYSNGSEIIEASTKNVTNKKYGWYSPLNTVIPIAKSNEVTKEFVWWLLTDNYVNRSENGLIQEKGYAPLSDSDKIKMFLSTSNITVDNYKNIESKQAFFDSYDTVLHEDNQKKWYGVPKE